MKKCVQKPLSYIDELLDKELNERLVKEMLPKTASVHEDKVMTYLRKNYPADTLYWVRDAEWQLKEVPLVSIQMSRRPGGARETDKVKSIAQAVKDGQKMEPVVLVETPGTGKLKIADGYHRTLGFEHANKSSIKAWVGKVKAEKGPWDKEMHEKKLNVGKSAWENNEDIEKLAVIAQMGNLALKAGKSLGKQTWNAGKTLSGANVYKASKHRKGILENPDATVKEIKQANRGLMKSKAGLVAGYGGVATAAGAGNLANKYVDEQKKMMQTPSLSDYTSAQKKYFTY